MSEDCPAKRIKLQLVNNMHNSNGNNEGGCSSPMDADKATATENGQVEIDEGLYSRQLYVMGKDAMKKMVKSSVLISGIDGLGVEIAKNVILSGVKLVTLHDNCNASLSDLSSHYYIREAEIQQSNRLSRAALTRDRLSELNSYVYVRTAEDQDSALPSETLAASHNIVVLCQPLLRGVTESALFKFAKFCHKNNVRLIVVNTCGIAVQVFVDLGDKFVVTDPTGEDPLTVMVQCIEKTAEGTVTCLEETRHGFQDGDYVTFNEVKGMTEVNNCAPRKIKVLGPVAFSIGDTTSFTEYQSGGICVQVTMPVVKTFSEMEKSIAKPEFLISDFGKYDRPALMHLCFRSLYAWMEKHGALPRPWNHDDGVAFYRLCQQNAADTPQDSAGYVDKLDARLVVLFAMTCSGNIAPIQAVTGGIVAQEVLKACSTRFTPIQQWFYFDCEEILPVDCLKVAPETGEVESCLLKCDPLQDRYMGQRTVLGADFQEKLENSRIFLVGAGAIGCELLKNFAMMGIGCGPKGRITITDLDSIEKSNLNRQFLFRPADIGKFKSECAAQAALAMNPTVNITAHIHRVGGDTEHIYTDGFFEDLDYVANALDNVEARRYMDRRCVYYKLPLLESGTLGTKGNVQVVVPFLTESYSSSQDPPEKSIPQCTLKNFPFQIEHTIQWARDVFEGVLVQPGELALQYLSDPENTIKQVMSQPGVVSLEQMKQIYEVLVDRPQDYQTCLEWARRLFDDYFTNQIKQLLHNFSPDQKTERGNLFWSGTKRCPRPLEFDADDDMHFAFVQNAANLRAHLFGIEPVTQRDKLRLLLNSIKIKPFKPSDNVKIAVTDAEVSNAAGGSVDEKEIKTLFNKLPGSHSNGDKSKIVVNVINFEKDDDSNGHIDFVTATSNLRASNYNIPTADRLKTKLIAGKIIPAIATTTGLVAGLVAIELYKLIQGHRSLEIFKNGFTNLALPFFGFSEPVPPEKKKYYDHEFSLWDRFDVDGSLTLREFIDMFQKKHRLQITMISQGVCMLYAFFLSNDKKKDRLDMTIPKLVEAVSKKPIPAYVRALVLEVCVNDTSGEDVEVPYIKYNMPERQ